MMNRRGKSDSAIVAGKPTNKAGQLAAESVEPRAEAEGNASQQSTRRAQDRESVTQALERIRQVARQRKKERFTSLFHHISVELLRMAFFALKRDAAPGVDGLTWQDYEADLDRKIEDLHARVHRGAYRALPSRRHYIPKADGRQRPLAIAALEDKIQASHRASLIAYPSPREWLWRCKRNGAAGSPRRYRHIHAAGREPVRPSGLARQLSCEPPPQLRSADEPTSCQVKPSGRFRPRRSLSGFLCRRKSR
jgi:hypothetical protein